MNTNWMLEAKKQVEQTKPWEVNAIVGRKQQSKCGKQLGPQLDYTNERRKKPSYFPLYQYWLFNRDPLVGGIIL